MDLGIAGKNAIVCASSRGLGRACAISLATAGAHVTINGRNTEKLKQAADLCHAAGAASVKIVEADVSTREGQDALLEATPHCDILVNNNGGPPLKDFRELDREAIINGVIQNMVTPIELIQRVLPNMEANRFGRIVNITSASVKMPILGLDLSSGARAALTASFTVASIWSCTAPSRAQPPAIAASFPVQNDPAGSGVPPTGAGGLRLRGGGAVHSLPR